MYKLYRDLEGPWVLNINFVKYDRQVQTQQVNYGGRSQVECIGYKFSGLYLEGPCDPLGRYFFHRLQETDVNNYPLSNFYIIDDESDYGIKVSEAHIREWKYTDSESNNQDSFSLVFAVENIQRLTSKKIKKETLKKVKEKR